MTEVNDDPYTKNQKLTAKSQYLAFCLVANFKAQLLCKLPGSDFGAVAIHYADSRGRCERSEEVLLGCACPYNA